MKATWRAGWTGSTFMKFTFEQFTRTLTFLCHISSLQPGRTIPILLMRLCDLLSFPQEQGFPHVGHSPCSFHPRLALQARGARAALRTPATLRRDPRATLPPAHPAANPHSSTVCLLPLWHAVITAARFIFDDTVLL